MRGIKLLVLCALFFFALKSFSQRKKIEYQHSNQFTLLTGLIQPSLLRGVNVAGTYFTNRLTFEYSHGMFLNYPKFLRKDKNTSLVYSPWSTGAGIGYRLSSKYDVRMEGKAHRYIVNLINDNHAVYTAYSFGIGIYSRSYIHKNWLLEYSLRYWPNVSSTLPDDKFTYEDAQGNTLVHKAHQLGLIFNISLGYNFNKNLK
jgi:hypothetical protein